MRIVKENKGLMVLEDNDVMVFVGGLIFLSLGFLLILMPDFSIDQIPISTEKINRKNEKRI